MPKIAPVKVTYADGSSEVRQASDFQPNRKRRKTSRRRSERGVTRRAMRVHESLDREMDQVREARM